MRGVVASVVGDLVEPCERPLLGVKLVVERLQGGFVGKHDDQRTQRVQPAGSG